MKKIGLSPALIAVVLLAVTVLADAQQAKKVVPIGWLSAGVGSSISGNSEAFRKGLIALGYVEGKDIEILCRYGEGKFERLPDLAAELVRLKVAVMVTTGTAATKAAKQATTEVPIVVGS